MCPGSGFWMVFGVWKMDGCLHKRNINILNAHKFEIPSYPITQATSSTHLIRSPLCQGLVFHVTITITCLWVSMPLFVPVYLLIWQSCSHLCNFHKFKVSCTINVQTADTIYPPTHVDRRLATFFGIQQIEARDGEWRREMSLKVPSEFSPEMREKL